MSRTVNEALKIAQRKVRPIDGSTGEPRTVPEKSETIRMQLRQLANGKRAGVFVARGTKGVTLPEGMRVAQMREGNIIFDPSVISKEEVIDAAQSGRLNELLGYVQSKPEALAQSLELGELPRMVVSRDENGVEQDSAAVSPDRAEEQAAVFADRARGGSTISTEHLNDGVLRDRMAEGGVPYGAAVIGEDKIILGSPHGEPIELSDELKQKVKDIAEKHGAWYEGTGGDTEPNKSWLPKYKGSWDEQHAASVKGYPVEYLAPMFSNVDVNKQPELFEDPNKTIMSSLIANQDKSKYFKDRRYDEKALRDFLQQGSEGDVDFLKMSQMPATKENLSKFFKTGESLMWPDNWQEYPHNLGKIAKRTEDSRNQFLLNAPPGVYVTGAGHIPELKRLNKDLQVIGGERAGYADGGTPDEESQEEFLKKELEGSAPQYDPEAGLLTGKKAALFGAGLLPGSGIASAAGKFPTAEGGFEPSAREDWKAGNYGSAALKAAGAAGDVVSAVPVAGTAAGALLKAPLAAKLAMAAAPAAKVAREAAQAGKETRSFFHGSPHKFSEFDLAKSPEGIHLTENENIAREYAGKDTPNVYKVQASYDPERIMSSSELIENQPIFSRLQKSPVDVSQPYTGEKFFQKLAATMGPEAATNYLREAGVQGMSYPAKGHYSFYDPSLLQITPEYKRLVNPAGFYSRAHEVASTLLPEGPRTWQEMRSLMMKQPGMKEQEMHWSGLHPEAYEPGHKLTREEIAQQVEKNFPMVDRVVKQNDADVRAADEAMEEAYDRAEAAGDWDEAHRLRDMYAQRAYAPLHESYTVPGGKNYSERVLTHEYNPGAEDYTGGKFRHESHLGDINNPIVHTRNSERVGPNGERILHQEELQSDWGQQGREKGFRKPMDEALRKEMNELDDAVRTPEQSARLAELRELERRERMSSEIPNAPFVGDTEHWLELAAKDTLAHAIENDFDKVFITGGQEQAKRWQNELRKAVDNVRWESPDASKHQQDIASATKQLNEVRSKWSNEIFGMPYEDIGELAQGNIDQMVKRAKQMPNFPELAPEGSKVVYAQPVGSDQEHRFVVQQVEGPNGKPRVEVVDSSIPSAKGETLSAVVGGDLAKRIMAEDSGSQAMKGYRMGSEGYEQTYNRKAPSVYKKLMKQLDLEAKVEAGPLALTSAQKREEINDFIEDFTYTNAPDVLRSYGVRRESELHPAQREMFADRVRQNALEAANKHFGQDVVEYALNPESGGVQGTYLHITPKMREEYMRLKKKHGSVFPAYKRGGTVDKPEIPRYTVGDRRLLDRALTLSRKLTE